MEHLPVRFAFGAAQTLYQSFCPLAYRLQAQGDYPAYRYVNALAPRRLTHIRPYRAKGALWRSAVAPRIPRAKVNGGAAVTDAWGSAIREVSEPGGIAIRLA